VRYGSTVVYKARYWPRLALGAILACLLGCGGAKPLAAGTARARASGGEVTNNVERSSYAGSRACEPCHADVTAAWARSPMHRMTRLAETAEIQAPFDGRSFRFKDDVATFETVDGARFVRLDTKRSGVQLYRVTRVIGGREREDFAGALVSSPAETVGGEEEVLPVSYLLFSRTFRYKGYSVLVHERPGLEAGPAYSRTCILCHNTAPYLTSLYGALGTHRMPPYQGEVVDRLLPDLTRWTYAAEAGADHEGMRRALAGEIGFLGGDVPAASGDALVRRAIDVTRERFVPADLVEVGIGCESCHGGSREHVASPNVRPVYEPRAPWLALGAGGPSSPREPSRAEQVNHVCARCHQVLFSHYPWTWEGGRRRAMPGGSNINSGEGRDFLLGGCSLAMGCTSCHDPHDGEGAKAAMPQGNALCLGCHQKLAAEPAQRAHSHHDPAGAAGACVACHMPKKNMSLDGRLTRYHRIGSPTDPLRVLGDRPLECALCHTDKTVESLVGTMEKWWGKAYDKDALTKLYGALDVRPLVATVERGKPHEQAVALSVLGEHGDKSQAPLLSLGLASELPLVRQYARDALRAVLGMGCDVRLEGDLAAIERDADACLSAAGLHPPPWPASASAPAPSEPPED